MEEIFSKRDRKKLYHEGRQFLFDKMSANGEIMWKCDQKNDACKTRLHSSSFTSEVSLIKIYFDIL